MPPYFDTGMFHRDPAWHGLGNVIDHWASIEEAMELGGHNFEVIRRPLEVVGNHGNKAVEGWDAFLKSGSGDLLHISPSTREIVQNRVPYTLAEAMVKDGNLKIETAITLKNGAVCSLLFWLDEPAQVPGDDAFILPWYNLAWSHDASRALSGRPTNIRTVCWNTQSAAEAMGKTLGLEFTFRHTKNIHERIADVKASLAGVRENHEIYMELARELATMPVTRNQRELFVSNFIPLPPEALISDRVMQNVEDARAAIRSLFDGPTVPDAHRFTAYGLHLAGVEYLDHLRGARNVDTKYGRSLLRDEPMKMKLTKLIRECVAS